MTILLHRQTAEPVDPHHLTALITRALVQPTEDDAPETHSAKCGTGWMRWSEGQVPRTTARN